MPAYSSDVSLYFVSSWIDLLSPETSVTRSQTSAAYARLRGDILAGLLRAGERLKINDLASALEVSPGAIREALSRLVPEQLVVSRDHKGFLVAPLSIGDLEDLTDLRCEIDAIALRRSVLHGEDGWEGSVLAAAHRLRKTKILSPVDRLLNRDWVERHQTFHFSLVSACGSPRLLQLHAHLYEQSERYRGLSFPTDGKRNRQGEHQALANAALARDADLLVELVFRHYRETTKRIVEAVRRKTADEAAPAGIASGKLADRALPLPVGGHPSRKSI